MTKTLCFIYTESLNPLYNNNYKANSVTKKNLYLFPRLKSLNYIIVSVKDNMFTEDKYITDNINLNYDNQNNDVKAGYISYVAKTGQIALFFINSDYRNRGLGKQVLLFALNDMKTFTPSHIWAITYINHPFWSNVFDKSFQWYHKDQLHPSVSSPGYKMKIT